MPLVLAIEPDRRQAAYIASVVRQRVGAQLILVDTTEHAIASLDHRAPPDLVLVPALLSPKDDAMLADALRTAAEAAPIRVLITPQLSATRLSTREGLMGRLRRGRNDTAASEGCDPAVFADQIAAYLTEGGSVAAAPQPVEVLVEPPEEVAEEAIEQAPEALADDFEWPGPPAEWLEAEPAAEVGPEVGPKELQVAAKEVEVAPEEVVVDNDLDLVIDIEEETEQVGAHQAEEHEPVVEQAVEAAIEPLIEQAAAGPQDDPEWLELVASLRRAVGDLRFEEWFGAQEPTAPPCDEWGLYDPDRCGIAALERYVDALKAPEAEP